MALSLLKTNNSDYHYDHHGNLNNKHSPYKCGSIIRYKNFLLLPIIVLYLIGSLSLNFAPKETLVNRSDDRLEEQYPAPLDGFKDIWDPPEEFDTPIFWHISKSGGTSFKNILGKCHRLTMASEEGILEGHDQDTELVAFNMVDNPWHKFVNVDTTHIEGLKRAKEMGLVPSRISDVIVVDHLFEANQLFDSLHKGRLFAVFRDPVDREISLFHYLQYATWERTYNEKFASMSLHEFAQSNYAHDNYLTRILSNDLKNRITSDHLSVAKRIIRTKVLVGLLSEKEKTMARFEKRFGWKFKANVFKPGQQERCREQFLGTGVNINENLKSDKAEPGSPGYEAIVKLNAFDIDLYKYIENMFWEQENFFQAMVDYRVPSHSEANKQIQSTFLFPAPLDGFKDPWDPLVESDTPMFWHVLTNSDADSFQEIFGRCHRLTVAARAGVLEGHDKDTELETFHLEENPWHKFVNTDTTSLPGIKRAKDMGLVPSGIADVIVVNNIFDADILFDDLHQGRVFALFQHPVKREISRFEYLQRATQERDDILATMSVQEYAQSNHARDNWLTRFLSKNSKDEIQHYDLRVARRIIREKVLVGLWDRKDDTMDIFEKFFGWQYHINPAKQEKCRKRFMDHGLSVDRTQNKNKYEPESPEYELIAKLNVHDIDLYNYIVSLFREQKARFKVIPDNHRLDGATCCECDDPTTC